MVCTPSKRLSPQVPVRKMKDWGVSFLAAALIVGFIVWCAKIFIEVMYG
jgi:hypothetical protein